MNIRKRCKTAGQQNLSWIDILIDWLIPFSQRERCADYEVKQIAGYSSQFIAPTKKNKKIERQKSVKLLENRSYGAPPLPKQKGLTHSLFPHERNVYETRKFWNLIHLIPKRRPINYFLVRMLIRPLCLLNQRVL